MEGLTESDAFRCERDLILKHVGPMLTNVMLNPNKKMPDKIILNEEMSLPEIIVDGVSYVGVKFLPQAFSIRKQRLDLYLAYCHIVSHRFAYRRGVYIQSCDVERIKEFVRQNKS
jgi:hypothetical protein